MKDKEKCTYRYCAGADRVGGKRRIPGDKVVVFVWSYYLWSP